jgi:hypothetical protein
MNNFTIEKINNLVWIFREAVDDSEKAVEYFKDFYSWKDWYTFGKVTTGPTFDPLVFDTFPTPEEWEKLKPSVKLPDSNLNSEKNKEKETAYFENKINHLFYYSTRLYCEANGITLDNWVFEDWNVARYIPNEEHHPDYVMMHHTDFQRDVSYSPGLKFGITVVFYLNDSFEGGEVSFRFLDEKDPSIIKEEYLYKPSRGDILVFPSGPPHYHGVKALLSGEKYIIRAYWQHSAPAHPLWAKLQEEYGPDAWEKMEAQRLKFNRKPENMKIINNAIFSMDFEEYYKKEIESLPL